MFDIDFSRIIEQLVYMPNSPMIFSSGVFLFLFLGFSLIYNALGRADTLRILFVTIFSYYFYYKSSGMFFWLLALVTVCDFLIAGAIGKVKEKGFMAKTLVGLSLFIDLGLLIYFKYTNFLGATICNTLADWGVHIPAWISGSIQEGVAWEPRDIFLPVGISFFTFQSLSYTIDVYRGNIRPLSRLLDYAFYVSFFPQLVAGPIVRARDFIPQIRRPLMVTNSMFGKGVFLIIAGLFKKAVISDYISVNFVERIFDQPDLYSGIENLLAVYGYTLQIYCDFSGYSDMAIGIALLLGFEFPKNFDNPYKSASITEFWRRWHISLSSWLKDYLYISLGGNRHGKFRQYVNLLMTMLLGGLWHGASLNFIIWGGLHGIFLCIDKIWKAVCPVFSPLTYLQKKKDSSTTRPWFYYPLILFSGLITFHLVATCWVLFRAPSFEIAQLVFYQITNNFQPQIFTQWCESYNTVAFLMFLGYVLHYLPSSLFTSFRQSIIKMPVIMQATIIVIVIYIVIQIKSSDVQPFIYFQF